MMHKKYYTISEVSRNLGVKEHRLRYLDALLGKKLTVIRGRRYYREEDIALIKNALHSTDKVMRVEASADPIDILMNSMLALRADLLSAL